MHQLNILTNIEQQNDHQFIVFMTELVEVLMEMLLSQLITRYYFCIEVRRNCLVVCKKGDT